MGRFAHVVQLRMTRPEMMALHRMAQLQQCSVEELIRNQLRLGQEEPRHVRSGRLKAVSNTMRTGAQAGT